VRLPQVEKQEAIELCLKKLITIRLVLRFLKG